MYKFELQLIIMYNVSELIRILLLKNGVSMRKLVSKMNDAGYEKMTIGGFSKMLKTESIKFTRVQDILDFLGYEFKVVKKEDKKETKFDLLEI